MPFKVHENIIIFILLGIYEKDQIVYKSASGNYLTNCEHDQHDINLAKLDL